MSSPPAKRQKLDSAVDVFASSTPKDPSSVLTVRDLSFQTPLRKKLNLIFTSTEIQAHSAAKQELSIPLSQIRHVISVAAPDKTAKTWNFVVMYGENEALDAWVFGVPETVAKTAVGSHEFEFDNELSYKSVLIDAFKQISGIVVAEPSATEFTSPIPLPGRPKEAAYHAVSHRGAKEGYLYFLSTGILYGFKKPVQFFPIDTIREVTFTNILQRTFNLVVSTEDNVEGEEFEMIDQALFPGVQGYTVKHKIQDASLSEERKAKRVGKENRNEEESGELEKAVKEYDAEYSDEDEDFRDFDKAEAEWDEDELPKGKGKGRVKSEARPRKRQPVPPQHVANGNDVDTSDDEELDATFEGGGSDDGSPGDTSDEDDSDDDSEADDEDEDEDDDGDEEDDDEDDEDED